MNNRALEINSMEQELKEAEPKANAEGAYRNSPNFFYELDEVEFMQRFRNS